MSFLVASGKNIMAQVLTVSRAVVKEEVITEVAGSNGS
jgi:hypothetical protein